MSTHESRMVRHPIVMRQLDVLRVEDLTPHMRRIVLGGEQLQGFVSAAPDDHVKLFFPNRHGEIVQPTPGPNGLDYPADKERSPMRDYTPRRYNATAGELVIDFVLHGDGPASTWAAQAEPGQRLGTGGPRGSYVVASDFDHYVMIGDETALPAIGRWLEELPATATATVLAEIPQLADRQTLSSNAYFDVQWLDRKGADPADSRLLERALSEFESPKGDTFWWIATESHRARAMRRYLSDERNVPKEWLKATGYWVRGEEEEGDED
ncbi:MULTISPECIES: siderophore-interacting protein [Dyella]|uniref:Siderophore-interacting protein n=2 Tax=Dyella TaxID=231454 RepID=A0A4R0Z0C6_9GAMM|nr:MULTISPECIES: siderophore-interacting protein [Dyella]TBR39854.1 siderophore-interacting protein [Dyella terrae]TCI12566.1 siderophore-interacting protein [Dyella soli]